MKEFQYTVKDENGIHARPAGMLVKLAKGFSSTITVVKGEKTCDMKKIMVLMGMAIKQGDTITVRVEGDDEEACAKQVSAFLAENF
jgi:phosphocarrier protein HPr